MNTQLVNEIRLIYRQLCIVQEQYAKAKHMVAGLRKLHTGSSNEPVLPHVGGGRRPGLIPPLGNLPDLLPRQQRKPLGRG